MMQARTNRKKITRFIKDLGATNSHFISPRRLEPEERIRQYCRENKCGCYNRHLMCPPATHSIEETTRLFQGFKTGILIQFTACLDVRRDVAGLKRTKQELHEIILKTESYLKNATDGARILGLIGGTCELCDECAGYHGGDCDHPDRARPSLEALAVDVISLLKALQLDGEFYDDRLTWTGIVLVDQEL